MSSDWRNALRENANRKVLIENVEINGKKIVKVVIQYKANPNQTTEFELDPAVNHRIMKSAIVLKGRRDTQYEVEYQADTVVPKVVTYITPTLEVRCEFLNLSFDKTPSEEFQPTFFGLPISKLKSRVESRNIFG